MLAELISFLAILGVGASISYIVPNTQVLYNMLYFVK